MPKKLKINRFDSSRQDKTMKLLLTDTEFVCDTRRFMRPEYFSSPIRQNLCMGVFDFFDKYGVSPNFEQIDDILTELVIQRVVNEDELDVYSTYVDRLVSDVRVGSIVKKSLSNNLKEYSRQSVLEAVKKAITHGRERDMPSVEILQYVTSAVDEIRDINSESVITPISDMMKVGNYTGEVVSCFNVKEIDQQLDGGIQKGFFYVVLGYTGCGKTWTLVHLGKMAARLGYLVVHVVIELSNKVLTKRYSMSLSAKRIEQLTSEYKHVREAVSRSLVRRSNIVFVDEEEKSASVDSLAKVVSDTTKRYGKKPDLVLVDSLEDYLPPTGKRYSDDWAAQRATFSYAKDFARIENIGLVSTAQAVKQAEKVLWLGKRHCSGAAEKVRKAVAGVSINTTELETKLGYCRFFVFKNNEGGEGGKAWVKRDLSRGQAVVDSGRYTKDYFENISEEGGND